MDLFKVNLKKLLKRLDVSSDFINPDEERSSKSVSTARIDVPKFYTAVTYFNTDRTLKKHNRVIVLKLNYNDKQFFNKLEQYGINIDGEKINFEDIETDKKLYSWKDLSEDENTRYAFLKIK